MRLLQLSPFDGFVARCTNTEEHRRVSQLVYELIQQAKGGGGTDQVSLEPLASITCQRISTLTPPFRTLPS